MLELALFLAASIGATPSTPEPEPVVGGLDAGVCEFPAAAAGLRGNGSHACTVVVLHPRVVMLAAHCIITGNLSSVTFGETVDAPARNIAIEDCAAHPGFAQVNELNAFDLAYCTLAEDAPAVPIVPPIMGCEVDQLLPGVNVTLPGYGIDDEPNYTGAGVKRSIANTVETVDLANNDLYLLGVDGASVCFGDSGGPAYFQLDDGTWRVVGITSESHPDTEGEEFACGYGAVYDLVHLEMEWIENATGYDLTPCFDTDGTWAPDESCGGFPTSVTTGGLSWKSACSPDEEFVFSSTCGEAFGEGDTSSTGAESSSSGDGSSSESSGDTTTTGTSGSGDETTGPPPRETTSTSTTTTGPVGTSSSTGGGTETDFASGGNGDGDGGGCGCRTEPTGGEHYLALLLLGLVRRRTRAPITTARSSS